MSDAFVRVAPDGRGKRIDNSLIVRGGQDIYRQRVETYNGSPANVDLDGATRSSQKLTLFDGKILNTEDLFKWDVKGTGTPTFVDNAIRLSVAAGQYMVRQGRFFCPYFSGKPQLIESTSFDFHPEPGLSKRIGYFSSNAVAPYDAEYDGWWIEANGDAHKLITSNRGTITHEIAWADMDAVRNGEITTYDWSKFSVSKVDFLWLGGAGLRFFLVVNGVFKLMHTIADHAGYQDRLIFSSPNQPVRYEIRSTTGVGALTSVCSQVSTEGTSPNEMGEGISWYSPPLAANSVGTVYALCGAKKQVAFRDHYCPVAEIGAAIQTADSGVLMLLINPTLSAPLTYTNTSRIQAGVALTPTTVTNVGRILKAVPMVESGVQVQAPSALLRNLAVGIDNTMSELVVAYAPQSSNQTVFGSMQVLEY